jgi:hypothetical protein
MNRLASALSLALVLSVGSCGDDEKSTADAAPITPDTGAGGSDGAAPTACTGSFMGVNSAQLAGAIALSSGPKSCAPDVALVCTGNIAGIAGTCGVSCLGMGKPCITACIKGQLATLSDACNGCYADTVLCTQMMCLTECVQNPAAQICTDCQIAKGCRAAFATCSGLPTGAPGDGGAPMGDGGGTDAPGTDGGVTDTAAADTAAADTAVSSDTSTD